MKSIGKLKSKILYILEKHPNSRNDDVILMLYIWKTFYKEKIGRFPPNEKNESNSYVLLRDIMDLPREDHIKRIRAKIQNVEHKFLPTDLLVAEKRFRNIKNWKEALGYAV